MASSRYKKPVEKPFVIQYVKLVLCLVTASPSPDGLICLIINQSDIQTSIVLLLLMQCIPEWRFSIPRCQGSSPSEDHGLLGARAGDSHREGRTLYTCQASVHPRWPHRACCERATGRREVCGTRGNQGVSESGILCH